MKFEMSTDRLELKVLTPESAQLVLDFYNRNSDIFQNYEPLLGEDFYSIKHQKNILEFEYKNILKLSMFRYFIFEKGKPDKIIGTVSFRNITKPIYSSATLGYKMDREYLNRGYCTEAIKASMEALINDMGIHRIEALVLPDNGPSIRVLEKLGFKKEGLLRDKIEINEKRLDHYMYSFIANN